MDFDINQLDHVEFESEEGEEAFHEFQQALVERFTESPEGQARLQADPDMGFWTAQLMYYGWQYEGKSVPRMTVGTVDEVVTGLFPRKISLQSPEDADDTIPELTAFWQYLKREYQLPQADAVLKFLRDVEPDFPGMMNNPSNFGMAKSFFAMGRAAGFDMTTQEGMNAFMLAFNARQLGRQSPFRPSLPVSSSFAPSRSVSPAERAAERKAERKRRKRAEKAQKGNPKRRK